MKTFPIWFLLAFFLLFQTGCGQKMGPKYVHKTSKKKTLLWTTDWSADDKNIAVGGDDSILNIYSGENLKLIKSYEVNSMIRQVKWHPAYNNLIAVATNDDKSILLDIETNDRIVLRGMKYGARGIGWNFNGELLATADNEGSLKIWDLKGHLIKTMEKEDQNSYFSLDWHPQKNILAVSGDDIRIFDTSGITLQVIKHRKENTGVLTIRWHPSGDFFAIGDYGHEKEGVKSIIQFWNTDGTLTNTLFGSLAEYRNIQWNKEGSLLASGSDVLRIWNKNGDLLFAGKPGDLLWGVDWNSTSEKIITTSINGHVNLWTAKAILIAEAIN